MNTKEEKVEPIYYHITPVKNIESIIATGIKSKNKRIFVVDDVETIHAIAFNQVFVIEMSLNPFKPIYFGLFKINVKGLEHLIINDFVADFTTENQFIIKNVSIAPNRLEYLGQHLLDTKQAEQLRNERLPKYIEKAESLIKAGKWKPRKL